MSAVSATLPGRRRFRADEVLKLVASGVLADVEPCELIDGDLIVVSPQGPVHITLLAELAERLRAAYLHGHHVRSQAPIAADEFGLPEPDIAVVSGVYRDYLARHPGGSEVVVAVEIAVTSQALDRAKASIYGRAGVPVYWLLDVAARRLEDHRHPSPRGYAVITALAETESVLVPGTGLCWSVASLLP